MDSEADFDPTSTPRLSLYSVLPSKPPQPSGTLTPPLQTLASIPFQWEEAPGRPRHIMTTTTDTDFKQSNKTKVLSRCLELPPRLLTSTSATVFDGPDQERRSLSHTSSFSFGGGGEEKVGGKKGRNMLKSGKIREKSLRINSSWRWGSFKDNRSASVGSFHFVGGGGSGGGGGESFVTGVEDDPKVKITRSVKRRSSFMSFSNSSVVANIYGSFKQAIAWRRRN